MKQNKPKLSEMLNIMLMGVLALIPVVAFIGVVLAAAYASVTFLERFTNPESYWSKKVTQAEQSLKSSMDSYDSCMNKLTRYKNIAHSVGRQMIEEGASPTSTLEIVQEDIRKEEMKCLAMEKMMEDKYKHLRYTHKKLAESN